MIVKVKPVIFGIFMKSEERMKISMCMEKLSKRLPLWVVDRRRCMKKSIEVYTIRHACTAGECFGVCFQAVEMIADWPVRGLAQYAHHFPKCRDDAPLVPMESGKETSSRARAYTFYS